MFIFHEKTCDIVYGLAEKKLYKERDPEKADVLLNQLDSYYIKLLSTKHETEDSKVFIKINNRIQEIKCLRNDFN
ncbi:MAG: hypothetical protein ACOZCL_13770 [Bacillota bacterium]